VDEKTRIVYNRFNIGGIDLLYGKRLLEERIENNMIPKTIKREHILKAIEQVDAEGYEKKNASTKYDLLHNRKKYPPKIIISLAYNFVTGSPHPVEKFSGGDESNNFLMSLGFSIINKDGRIIHTPIKNDTLIQTEDDADSYTEGKEKFITHKSYERNPLLSKRKKETSLKEHGKLECEVCGFDFYKTYGERGYGFKECHHTGPSQKWMVVEKYCWMIFLYYALIAIG
jgi:predicted HNH restriction endonuclease